MNPTLAPVHYGRVRLRKLARHVQGNVVDVGFAQHPNPPSRAGGGRATWQAARAPAPYTEHVQGDVRDITSRLDGRRFDTVGVRRAHPARRTRTSSWAPPVPSLEPAVRGGGVRGGGPLGAEVGYDVVGFDVDEQRVERWRRGSFVEDVTDDERWPAIWPPVATARARPGRREEFDVAVITVPTPLRDGARPLHRGRGATARPRAAGRRLVILESTTYPGHHRGAGRPDPRGRLRPAAGPTSTSATAPSASIPATRRGPS